MIENIQVKKRMDPWIVPGKEGRDEANEHPLDSPESRQRLRQLEDWWYQARQHLALARYEMAMDHDYYDGLQWADEDAAELDDRGQIPLKFNQIKPAVDWILGSEKRTRVDSKVYPREASDVEPAGIKGKLLKYISDVNKTGYARSEAFRDSVIGGLGWLEDAIRNEPGKEPLFSRWESWRNIWYDHLAQEKDLSDARYLFRSKWVDVDIAVAMFPDREAMIRGAANWLNMHGTDDDEFWWLTNNQRTADGRIITTTNVDDAFNADNRRDRVRLIEGWYRVPAKVQIIRGVPRFEGTIYNKANAMHMALIQQGLASTVDAVRMLVRCAVFIGGGINADGCLLQDMPSPYNHNRFPFTPVWCYRRDRDRTPYGVVRNLRDPQDDLNKRRSKALYILSTKGMVADKDAFEDWDEVAEELSRPDFILKKKKGFEVELHTDIALAEEHVMLMREDKEFIQGVSGVTDELMGRTTNAVSGTAIQARQNQGSVVTAEIFDNLRFAIQLQGETQLSLIEQFYDEAKTIRITEAKGLPEFLGINQPKILPDGQVMIENDITATQADFVVDTQDFRESVRTAMFESLMNLCGQLPPEVAFNLLDLVIDLVDIPGKNELVKRIRKLNGQVDPEQMNDPEAMAEQEAREAEEAEQAEMQKQALMNQLQEQEAKIRKLLADAQLVLEKVETERQNRDMAVDEARMEEARFSEDQRGKRHNRNLSMFKTLQEAERNAQSSKSKH